MTLPCPREGVQGDLYLPEPLDQRPILRRGAKKAQGMFKVSLRTMFNS